MFNIFLDYLIRQLPSITLMFYKSYSDKYVMKVINSGEMNKFNEFALSYFEYMCRSFNQKCPTSIGKILGAFKISIK